MKTIFIISSKAGNVYPSLEDEITALYSKTDLDFKVYVTENKNSIKEIAKKYSEEDCVIYVCGGDGSLNEAAVELVEKKASLGLIPLGTANDFSKNFDYSTFSLKDTLTPILKPCDIIQINDTFCINILSFGLDTIVLANTYRVLSKFPSLKSRAYIFGILMSIFKPFDLNLDIELSLKDGSTFKTSDLFTLGAVCNGGYYGNGFNPSKNSIVNDSTLEIILVKKLGLFRLLNLLPLYKTGNHLNSPEVLSMEVESGTIKSKDKVLANINGEIFESNEINFKILKSAINFAYLGGIKH